MLDIPVSTLAHFDGLTLPAYATPGAAGLDLVAAISAPLQIPPLGRSLVPTGLTIAVPTGFEAQVRPRSGLALKLGLTVLNAPGTIDSDYRGEIQVLLVNLGASLVTIERGMRIAQLIIARYERIQWQAVASLASTQRGDGGFGSTGTGAPISDRGR